MRLIECRECQRPWPRDVGAPVDRVCILCRNPELEPLTRLGMSNDATCGECGLTVIEPRWLHQAEHCAPMAPPTPDYRAAMADLHNANVQRHELEEAA